VSSRTVFALVLLAVLGIGAAWLAGGKEAVAETPGVDAPLLPGLSDKLNDVGAVSILTKDGRFTVRKDGSTWKVVEHDDYPAKFETLKKTLVSLGNMTTLEAKTSNPDLYRRLGVDDPEQPDSDAVLITLLDGSGNSLGAVVLGKTGNQPGTLYARRASEAQSWLVHGELYLERKSTQWLDTEAFRLDGTRIQSVLTEHADGEKLLAARDTEADAVLAVRDPPEGKQPKSSNIARMQQSALEPLTFDDVVAAEKQPLPETERVVTTYETFDGLKVVITTAREEAPAEAEPPADGAEPRTPRLWAKIEVSARDDAADTVKAEATAAAARVGPWVYALPDWKAGNLRKRMADMVMDIPPPEPEATPAADAPPATEDEHAGHGHDAEPAPPPPTPPAEPPPADAPSTDPPK
jgi:Domain of unknown function (DUF4340)